MRAASFFAFLFLASLAIANEPDGNSDSEPVVLSDHALSVIETVVQNHIDPPTKQSLALAFCKQVSPTKRQPLGLGRAVSIADHEQLRLMLADQIADVKQESRRAAVQSALADVLQSQASTRLIKRKEQIVNDQLAANRYVGIGIAIGLPDNQVTMMKVIEGGPADRGGAKDRDRILRVDGISTAGKKVTEVVDMLRGPTGSEVEIVLGRSAEKELTLVLTRDVVPFKHVRDFKVIQPGIASVTIDSITGSIVRDLRRLTPKIIENEIKGVVLQINATQVAYRAALMFANTLIDGKPIGGVESGMGIEPIMADRDLLWPGVQIAAISQYAPQDAYAWALSAIRQQRPAYIGGQLVAREQQIIHHAWQYGTVELEGTEFVLVLPVARLLKTVESLHVKPLEYEVLGQRTVRMEQVNPKEMALLRSSRVDGNVNGKVTPIERAVSALRRSIARDEKAK